MKKLGMCSVMSCNQQAVHEIKYKSGTVGEYCEKHYAARIKEATRSGEYEHPLGTLIRKTLFK